MTKTLDVYFYRDLVGQLNTSDGQMSFTYTSSWLNQSQAFAISHSLPLQTDAFTHKQCQGFFGGLLPEDNKRQIIARHLGISAHNDYAMLQQIGGECAGAITFVEVGQALLEKKYAYQKLNNKKIAEMIRELPGRPLMAGDADVRLSLAGAQDKMAVHVSDGKISIPLFGAPSTHILKPAIPGFDGIVFNEALCLQLADKVALPTAHASVHQVENIDYLLVERYDRKIMGETIVRVHQEDFCQALGVISEMKYQREGGPSLKQCFALVREVSAVPVIDLQKFLDAVIFNFLIGNNDAHGKNFSLLYNDMGKARLAPLYDLISTAFYSDLTPKMAMKIGSEYLTKKVLPRHFEQLAEESGLSKPMVKKRVAELSESVLLNLKNLDLDNLFVSQIKKLIKKRCEDVLRIF